MAIHSSILAWEIPWTEGPGWLQSMGSQRVGHNCSALEKEMATHSSILAWRIPWTEEPGVLQAMGSGRLGHNRVTDTYLCDGIESMNSHIGTDTAQQPMPDTGTKVYMTLPVHEQRSILSDTSVQFSSVQSLSRVRLFVTP